jgi:glycosyltransferase involved in cell wall biosynthesis
VSRVLYVVARESRFTQIDREALAEAHEVADWSGRHPVKDALGALAAVRRADVVVAWFAGWHAVVPVTAAWLLRKPSVVITGGYDVANVPEADYGMQRGGLAKVLSRWVLRRATRLMANSHSGAREAAAAAPRATVSVVHHGVPDLGSGLAVPHREGALTVGIVDRRNLLRKGLRPFVEVARELPDVPFTLAGRVEDPEAGEELSSLAGENVTLAGFVDDDALARLYATAKVYVQPSLHEGFGMTVAEAMLAGCVPVVSDAGSLPEVVGDAGVVVARGESLADGIRRGLTMDGAAARERVLERFTIPQRAEGVRATVDAALRKT